MITVTARKRMATLLASVAAAALLLVGCATANPEAGGSSAPPSSPSDHYPVTIDSAYGKITFKEKPKRIVALSPLLVDSLISIGEQPVVISGIQDETSLSADFPWLKDLHKADIDPALNVEWTAVPEAVASWKPDLIIGDPFMIDKKMYSQLSQIAPTYAGQEAGQGVDWEQAIVALGSALNKEKEASQAVSDVEASFTEARGRLKCLQGKSYNSGFVNGDEIQIASVGALGRLGLTATNKAAQGHSTTPTMVSLENLEQLDADVLAIGTWARPDAQKLLEADPRFVKLRASTNKAVLYFGTARVNAGNGPLGFAWLSDSVTQELANSKYCAG